MSSSLRFLAEAMRHPLKTGALWPSSKALSQVVADQCHVPSGAVIVELGAGTGALTELILQRLNSQNRFLVVEINRTHATFLQGRFPQCKVIHDAAENLEEHLSGARAACIVSGLPWTNMFAQAQDQLLKAIVASLAPGGQFVAFSYAHAWCLPSARRFRALLGRRFSRVEFTPIVWKNLPPAKVLRCWKDRSVARNGARPDGRNLDLVGCGESEDECEVNPHAGNSAA